MCLNLVVGSYFFDKNTFPEGNIYLVVREVLNVTEPYQSAELRRHTVDSIMLFLGKGEGLSGMLVEVEIDGKKYTLESPVAVYVPAGTWHTYRILKGSGIYMKIVFAPHGDYYPLGGLGRKTLLTLSSSKAHVSWLTPCFRNQ
jgi:hypothetical protein